MNGFFIINKESDWTSRDVDNKIGHLFHFKKVGHAGTLDPFATGILLVAINNATKCLNYVDCSFKTYKAELLLGKKTNSGDLTGEIIDEQIVPFLTTKIIEEKIQKLVGKISQTVPLTSAVHVDGKKLYQWLHEGKCVEQPKRECQINYIKILDYNDGVITFETEVSSGTYIRTLGEDIAKLVGTVGYLKSLQRIKIGNSITLDKAKTISEITLDDIINPNLLIELPEYILSEEEFKSVLCGKSLKIQLDYELIKLTYEDKAIAIYKKDNDVFKSERGLW